VPQHPIAVSTVTATRLARIGSDRDRIRTVPNGIDYEQIRETAPASQGFDVLFAGRLIEDKRVDLLLEAFDRVAPPDATLGIVGDGPERESLEARASGLESADRITFVGFLEEYEAVLAHMRAARVFASPSTREGFDLTYAEAMAAGCTVIGAAHPESAADEVIGEGGFLAEPTVAGVAAALERALGGDRPAVDPQVRAKRFDWDRVAAEALDAYTDAATGRW
jgi:glycosyltransferase involved in cell wall biosynthesis